MALSSKFQVPGYPCFPYSTWNLEPGTWNLVAYVFQAHRKQRAYVGVVKGVVNDLAVAPALDEAELLEHFQVLRHGRLTYAHDGGQVAGAQLPGEEAVHYLG